MALTLAVTNKRCLFIYFDINLLFNKCKYLMFVFMFISFRCFLFFANKLNFLRDRQTNGLMLVGFCTFLVVSSYDDYSVLHYIFVNIYIMRLVSYVIIYPSLVNLKYIIYLIIYLEINYIYDVISNLGGGSFNLFLLIIAGLYLSLDLVWKHFDVEQLNMCLQYVLNIIAYLWGYFFFLLLNITTVFI